MSSRLIDAATLGPQRRRRHMSKLLAQLDQLDRDSALRLPPPQAKPKTHRLGSFLVVLLLLVGGAGIFFAARRHTGHRPSVSTTHTAAVGNDSTTRTENVEHLAGRVPSPGVGEQKTRLLAAVTPPAGTGGYALEPKVAAAHERYDPCRAIHYVVRDQNTPPGGDEAISEAVAALSQATGLKFVYDGKTTEVPSLKRPAYEPARYGDRWAPVMIAWTNPAEIPSLGGRPIGLGGSTGLSVGKGSVLVSGNVWLDTAGIVSSQSAYPNKPIIRAVVEHELGHVVGLGHVKDPTQVMYPDDMGVGAYGVGDRRGLAYGGSGACHPEL